MLPDIEPDLQNVACRHTVFPDNSSKDALAAPRNTLIDVGFFFLGIPRKTEVLQNFRVQTLQLEVRFHPVHKFEQPEAQTRPR